MNKSSQTVTVLMAEDDEEDRMLTREAWDESRIANDLRFVVDGEELMDYLYRRGRFGDPSDSPRPGLILLDLNMPKKDGREALHEIKTDPDLRRIPVVILTTSKAEEDVFRSYDLGASGYISKRLTLRSLIEVVEALGTYWVEIVELPTERLGA